MTKRVEPVFGRIEPTTRDHEVKYDFRALMLPTAAKVEKTFPNAFPRSYYNQGDKPECVAYAQMQMQSHYNGEYYWPHAVYVEAQKIDGVTEPHEGTSTVAGLTTIMNMGCVRYYDRAKCIWRLGAGIKSFRWGTTIDHLRTAFANNMPVVMGVPWYESFMYPYKKNGDWWVDISGQILGGHEIYIRRCSDLRSAVLTPNTWGTWFPEVNFSYKIIERLVNEGGDMGIATDLPTKR